MSVSSRRFAAQVADKNNPRRKPGWLPDPEVDPANYARLTKLEAQKGQPVAAATLAVTKAAAELAAMRAELEAMKAQLAEQTMAKFGEQPPWAPPAP